MIRRQPGIPVKTMTDYSLDSFIKCPYTFYYQHILMLHPSQIEWRQMTQCMINHVVQHYYQLPQEEQNKLNIMKLIYNYWENIDSGLFQSQVHYYKVLAKTTDYLLRFLSNTKKNKPPLFLYQKFSTYIEELETDLTVTLDVVEWASHSFTVNTFLVEADEEIILFYHYLLVVFTNAAFGKLPVRIEINTVLDGKKHTFLPEKNDVVEGINFLDNFRSCIRNHIH